MGGAFTKLDLRHSRPTITSSSSAAKAYYTPLVLHTRKHRVHIDTCNIKIIFYDSFKRKEFYFARTKGHRMV